MRLTVLGSGTMTPTKERHPSGYLLEEGDHRMLLDCGHTTVARLVELGIDLQSIDTVAVTHFHTDHFGDLLPFVHSRFVDDLVAKRKHKALSVIGPATTRERFAKLREVMWPEPSESYPVTFHEFQRGQEPLQAGPFSIQQFTVNHVPWFPSAGLRVSSHEASLVYPGDLGSQQEPEFEDAIRDADALLVEGRATELSPNHFTTQQALELAMRCNIRRVLLTHIHQGGVQGVQDLLKDHPSAMVVNDLMKIELE